MARTYERVKFSLLYTPCCHTLLCHVNPRLPNYCPECGERLHAFKQHPENILFTDDSAGLRYTEPDIQAVFDDQEKAHNQT